MTALGQSGGPYLSAHAVWKVQIIPQSRLGLPTSLGERGDKLATRMRSAAGRPLTARSTALAAALTAAAAVASNELRPQPWHFHLLAPLAAGGVGWLLAARYGDRPRIVVWGLLGLFTGASAAQRLEDYGMVLPLALAGCVVGVLVSRVQGPEGS